MNNNVMIGSTEVKIYSVGLKGNNLRQSIKALNKKEAIKKFQNILRPIYGKVSLNSIVADLK